MYVHADRGASRATKTSVRATNMKHVGTREHTDEPRQRTHRERGGERAESAGLWSLVLLSFFHQCHVPFSPYLRLFFTLGA